MSGPPPLKQVNTDTMAEALNQSMDELRMNAHNYEMGHIPIECFDGPSSVNGEGQPSAAPLNSVGMVTESTNSHASEMTPISTPGKFRTHLLACDRSVLYDLVCVGFGPSNLAVAVALDDGFDIGGFTQDNPPKVLFLEKQKEFGWHEGMMLPNARMQISFIKDLATLRYPRSFFTFVNYLHEKDRLAHFSDLATFTPTRAEYLDYMKWCASYFDPATSYGCTVTDITAGSNNGGRVVDFFKVTFRTTSFENHAVRARHVVVGMGGRPSIPRVIPAAGHPQVIHSSQYLLRIGNLLKDRDAKHRVAVVGSGQSAAEIFNDLHSRYPNASTHLITRSRALQAADDTPFVNDIFHADRVDEFFEKDASKRQLELEAERKTNYGVVSLDLLQKIYATMYSQRVKEPDEKLWQHRILSTREIINFSEASEQGQGVGLSMRNASKEGLHSSEQWDKFRYDAVILAVGYKHDGHEKLLKNMRALMPGHGAWGERWTVGRNYRVNFGPGKVAEDAGVWLQGCNESTHGMSDTLLSLLAVRGGEIVYSIFKETLDPAMED